MSIYDLKAFGRTRSEITYGYVKINAFTLDFSK